MNVDDKKRIITLRKNGLGYKKIAQILGMNESTVKTFCRRNGLNGTVQRSPVIVFPGVEQKTCKNCGELFLQYDLLSEVNCFMFVFGFDQEDQEGEITDVCRSQNIWNQKAL